MLNKATNHTYRVAIADDRRLLSNSNSSSLIINNQNSGYNCISWPLSSCSTDKEAAWHNCRQKICLEFQIAVMKKGEILEVGNHESLMQKEDGVYRKMVERQVDPSEFFDA